MKPKKFVVAFVAQPRALVEPGYLKEKGRGRRGSILAKMSP